METQQINIQIDKMSLTTLDVTHDVSKNDSHIIRVDYNYFINNIEEICTHQNLVYICVAANDIHIDSFKNINKYIGKLKNLICLNFFDYKFHTCLRYFNSHYDEIDEHIHIIPSKVGLLENNDFVIPSNIKYLTVHNDIDAYSIYERLPNTLLYLHIVVSSDYESNIIYLREKLFENLPSSLEKIRFSFCNGGTPYYETETNKIINFCQKCKLPFRCFVELYINGMIDVYGLN